MTTEGITGMIQSVLYTKLSSYMNSYELETLVKQLAEIFIMTGGGQSVETVEYITGRDVNPCTLLYTGARNSHSVVIIVACLFVYIYFTPQF